MITAMLFIVAAAGGAVLRAVVGTDEWRTAALNIVGSFLLGLVSQWTSPTLTVVGVGVLGSLTTFSTFLAHWVEKLDDRTNPAAAIAFPLISLAGGIAAAYLGLEIAT